MIDQAKSIDLSLRQTTLLLIIIGAITLAVGLVLAAVGGAGEYGYYQCVASSGAGCTSNTSNQYVTVFLANNDLLTIGMNVLLVGVLILLAGIVTMYVPISSEGFRPSTSPMRLCPKCGAQVEASHQFCGACGNNLA
jgi:ribosomal protein S27AE